MPYKDKSKQRDYQREHYLKYKTTYLQNKYNHREKLREYVRRLKSDKPCLDCKVTYPYYVMDFDHLQNKEGLINQFVNNNNKSGLEKELANCELVCANCHRIRTYKRLTE